MDTMEYATFRYDTVEVENGRLWVAIASSAIFGKNMFE